MRLRLSIKEYIQPFERRLAIEELAKVTGHRPVAVEGNWTTAKQFEAKCALSPEVLLAKLAYWETVEGAGHTHQVLREATANVVRNGIDLAELPKLLPFKDRVPIPNRRSLRYGVHGIHEYRGKFFPQLVLSLINVAGLRDCSTVLDPMSGSGTTLVEAAVAGHCSYGLDLNPLSVLLGRVKCELLSANTTELALAYTRVRTKLLQDDRPRGLKSHFGTLPPEDRRYLESWFAHDVLQGLDTISAAISVQKYAPARNLMLVALSNVLRRVSWQKDDDLRVRKEIRIDVEIDPIKEFLEELGRSIRAVLALRYQAGSTPVGNSEVIEGDARQLLGAYPYLNGKVDLVVTSPPYATALPYLDTDRLSLCYLGLLTRPRHRAKDYDMIGNRELTEGLRRGYLQAYKQAHELPKSIRRLIDQIEKLNAGANVGFRRRNLPALLAKYFLDMRQVLAQVQQALRPGALAFFVVGNNHTVAGGKRVDIRTADLLKELATSIRFEAGPSLQMEMLVSRDIFRNNASESEAIVALRKSRS